MSESRTAEVYPNVANLLRGKTRQSAPDVSARRLGEDEAYLTVRDILSESSTVADCALSRERRGFYRCGFATLGFILSTESRLRFKSRIRMSNPCKAA